MHELFLGVTFARIIKI